MADDTSLKGSLDQIKRLLTSLGPKQAASIAILALTVVGVVMLMVNLVDKTRWEVLFSRLSAEDAGQITSSLRASKIPYELSDGGQTVMVPADRVGELRIQLASEGLPQGGHVGFEIFDDRSLGMTEFEQRIQYNRALEGELSRTVMSLSEVAAARVHVVHAKESVFQDRRRPPKASVVVKLRSGHELSSSSVRGLTYLVASAVDGLEPQQVTVIDHGGRLLSKPSTNSEQSLSEVDQTRKANLERTMEARVVELLEPVVGRGRVRATASVMLDLNRVETTEERFDPDGQVVRSESLSDEKAGAPASTTTPTLGSQSTSTVNYEISKTVQHTVAPFGKLERISVAVLVDNATQSIPDPDGAQGALMETSVPRAPEEMTKLRDIVVAAIGFDEARGDRLTVENIPFSAVSELPADLAVPLTDRLTLWLRYLRFPLLILAAVLALIFVLKPMMKKVLAPLRELPAATSSTLGPGQVAGAAGAAGILGQAGVGGEVGGAPQAGQLALQAGEQGKDKTEVEKLVEQNPTAAQETVKHWLSG